jgi:hypothetical protein
MDGAPATAKAEALWLVDGLHPTLRDETAKDGAPGRFRRGEEYRQRQKRGIDWERSGSDTRISPLGCSEERE